MRILKFFHVVRGPASFAGLSWLLVAILLSGVMDSEAADARIAVAANFRDTAVTIATVLEQESSYRYEVIVGSTGKLASQIVNGAPFDVLMAADRRRPQQLIERGLAVAGSEQIYAIGQLGLWWPDANF